MNTARLTIRFIARPKGSKGLSDYHNERRTVTLPSPFTLEQAKEAARIACEHADHENPAWDRVRVVSVAFN
jgi:hypothetical protein